MEPSLKGEVEIQAVCFLWGRGFFGSAAIEPTDGFLRAGCLLTLDPASDAEWRLVHRDGKRDAIALDAAVIKTYAQDRADKFGKGQDRPVRFDRALAKEDVRKADKKAKAG